MRISSRLQVIVYIFALVFGVRHANPARRVQINNVWNLFKNNWTIIKRIKFKNKLKEFNGTIKVMTLDQLNGLRCNIGRLPLGFPSSKLNGPANIPMKRNQEKKI
jgi:hypothetical protein